MNDVNAPLDDLHRRSAAATRKIRRDHADARSRLGLDRPADYTLPTKDPTT